MVLVTAEEAKVNLTLHSKSTSSHICGVAFLPEAGRPSLLLPSHCFIAHSPRSTLRDIWAAYRRKKVHVEVTIRKALSEPRPKPVTISKEEADEPAPEIKKATTEVQKSVTGL